MDDLKSTMFIAGSGMRAQGTRIRVISENLANQDSTAQTPGGDPFRRKIVTFGNVLDRALGADVVRVRQIAEDSSPFGLRFDPNHPGADEDGYLKTPNVTGLIETMDMMEARRSYEANLNVIRNARAMVSSTLEILR